MSLFAQNAREFFKAKTQIIGLKKKNFTKILMKADSSSKKDKHYLE